VVASEAAMAGPSSLFLTAMLMLPGVQVVRALINIFGEYPAKIWNCR
jgi:hypothetical protein